MKTKTKKPRKPRAPRKKNAPSRRDMAAANAAVNAMAALSEPYVATRVTPVAESLGQAIGQSVDTAAAPAEFPLQMDMSIPTTAPAFDPSSIAWVEWYDDHFYRVKLLDDSYRFLNSVTSALGIISEPFFGRWRGDLGNREADRRLNEAGDAGSRIHHAIYSFVNGGAAIIRPAWNKFQPLTDEQIAAIHAKYSIVAELHSQEEMIQVHRFERWWRAINARVIGTEQTLVDLDDGVAGTLDLLMELPVDTLLPNGATPVQAPAGIYVVDYKTGAEIPFDITAQLGKYRQMVEKTGVKVAGAICVHTKANTRSGAIPGLATTLYTLEQLQFGCDRFGDALRLYRWKNAARKPRVDTFPAIIASDITPAEAPPANVNPNPKGKAK